MLQLKVSMMNMNASGHLSHTSFSRLQSISRNTLSIVACLIGWLLIGSVLAQDAAPSDTTEQAIISARQASQEILKLVPKGTNGCVIIEDLGGLAKRMAKTTWARRVTSAGLADIVTQANPDLKWGIANAAVRQAIGLPLDELLSDVMSPSIVLAFRQSEADKQDDIGIFFVRAKDPAKLIKVLDRLAPNKSTGATSAITYKGVSIRVRSEKAGRLEYVAQFGSVVAWSDKLNAIESVIDTAQGAPNWLDHPEVVQMRENLPTNANVSLLVLPRQFDATLQANLPQANVDEQRLKQFVINYWRKLDWLAGSLSVDPNVQLGVHAKIPSSGALPSTNGTLFEHGPWDQIPEQVVSFLFLPVQVNGWLSVADEVLGEKERNDLRNTLNVAKQFIAGFDLEKDVFEQLGPFANLMVLPTSQPQRFDLVGYVQWRQDPNRTGEQAKQLEQMKQNVELAIRPILVVIGVEHNRNKSDHVEVRDHLINGMRIHFLTGSHIWPNWVQPAYHVGQAAFAVANRPEPIAELANNKSPFAKSSTAARLQKSLNGSLFGYVDLNRVADLLEANRESIVERQEGQQNKNAQSNKLTALISLCRAFECATMTRVQKGDVQSFYATFVPADATAAPTNPPKSTKDK